VTAFGTFFLPGPTEVRPEVLAAMTRPMIAHRGAEFEALYARCDAGLRRVFRTQRPVFISSSSATGLMEGGVRCAPAGTRARRGQRRLLERFAEIARACGREVDVLAVPFGRAADPDDVARRLDAGRYAAVTVAHSETSSGALTDVVAVGAAARAHGARCLVDSVTALGAAPLDFDASDSTSCSPARRRRSALPAGLAFAAATEGVHGGRARRRRPRALLRPGRVRGVRAKRQTPNTPAMPAALRARRAARAHRGQHHGDPALAPRADERGGRGTRDGRGDARVGRRATRASASRSRPAASGRPPSRR
jgi:aspartate aminotransferase-like enzyme